MQKIKEKTFNYFTVISIPGIPGIFNGNNIFFKIFWTLLMLGLFGVGFWNIALAVNDFYSYDVITNIKRVTPEKVIFPAITICSDGLLNIRFFENNELVKSEDHIYEKLFDLFFDKVLFKTYDHKSSNWIELNAMDRMEYFVVIETYKNLFCWRFNSISNKEAKQLITANSTLDHFIVFFEKRSENNANLAKNQKKRLGPKNLLNC